MAQSKRFSPEQLAPRFDPAYGIVEAFGGVTRLGKLMNVAPSTVLRWTQSREVGGTGGIIPPTRWNAILLLAMRRSIPINREALIESPRLRAASRVNTS